MIELKRDRLVFSFPEVHPDASLHITFMRTLRIPDDSKTYPLPPGLGAFPLRHIDDHPETAPPGWLEHGGVLFPMYQSEALWIQFQSNYDIERAASYPFAIKVATGKINAVTGKSWSNGLNQEPQDYMVAPRQPWLDGYCVSKGMIRQFVAMPLGAGYSAEEQITGKAEHGGLQLVVFPMKREVFERRFPFRAREAPGYMSSELMPQMRCAAASPAMGLAPGGKMRQEIYDDPFDFTDWDASQSGRCFAHIANSLVWQAITGQAPPNPPPTSKQYSQAGLPWFDYYDESAKAMKGSKILQGLKSVFKLGQQKGDVPLPENESAQPGVVVEIGSGRRKDQVREMPD